VEEASAAAVRVTWVPDAKLVPPGLLITVPLPVPLFVTVRVYEETGMAVKVAEMVWPAVNEENV
jgi:hypothetical protein